MEELEAWELEEQRSPDCDGAYWMMRRGRKELLDRCFAIEFDDQTEIQH